MAPASSRKARTLRGTLLLRGRRGVPILMSPSADIGQLVACPAQKIEPFRPRKKGALKAVQNQPVYFLARKAKLGVCQPVFITERDPRHQPAVGAERHVEARIKVAAHRVFRGPS